MNRFRVYYATSLEQLADIMNGMQTMFSSVVYFGPTIPPVEGDKACMAVLDFSFHPVITQEEILMAQNPGSTIDQDEYKMPLTA